jgi:PAS domain S-box-containing protein
VSPSATPIPGAFADSAAQARALLERTPAALAADDRLAALEASGLLDARTGASLDRVARLARRLLRVPVAQVNLLTADAQVPVACDAPNPEAWCARVGLERSYCQYVVALRRTVVVPDTRLDPLVRGHRATSDAGIVAYAAAPLVSPAARGGHVLGTVCVVDFAARDWSADDVAALEDLAALAVAQVEPGWIVRDAVSEAREALAADAEHGRAIAERLAGQLAELESVYLHAGVGLCVLDTELRWVRINERLAEMNGFPPEAHVGRRVRDLLPGVAEQAEAAMRRVIETGEPLLDVEFSGETPAQPGVARTWREHFLPLRDAVGRVVGVNVVCEEVTERRRADAERARLLAAERQARAEAEAAGRAKMDFLATMSHELRTPLNAIGGYTDLLGAELYGPVTDAQRDALGRIRRSGRHLLGLIDEVLNYARIEAGAVRYRLDDVPVADAIAAAETLVQPQAGARGIAVVVEDGAERGTRSPVYARADAARLQQILVNLLANAVKYTERGGTVTLGCEAVPGRVLVHVRDTGIGIGPEKLATVFEPFVQGDRSLSRPQEGVGLGLAISRDLARGMGGDLVAESTPGVGSTFTVVLPRGRSPRRGRARS